MSNRGIMAGGSDGKCSHVQYAELDRASGVEP
jgi:hypothetical protein